MARRPAIRPEDLDIAMPAPDGALWACGHPKTWVNTQPVGKGRDRCRICRRKVTRESNARRRALKQTE